MKKLNLSERIKKLDKSNLLGSARQLAWQCQQTYEDLKSLTIPSNYRQVNKIVLNGMGGSRLGGRVVERLFAAELKIPLIPMGYYKLPAFVDAKTLLILSSWSGTTEEILATLDEALKRKAKILILAQTGELANFARKQKLPGYYHFLPKYNPCNQPRMSLGYQVLGIILFLKKCGLIQISNQEIENLILFLKKNQEKAEKEAQVGALKLKERIPILIGADFLMGALHTWRNQINENSKQLAFYFEIPELNHHLLEALAFPQTNPQNLFFYFIKSQLYLKKINQRIAITQKILKQLHLPYEELHLKAKNKLEQVFEVIQFGSLVSFYLAMLNNLDPSPIPWVNYFKESLAKFSKEE